MNAQGNAQGRLSTHKSSHFVCIKRNATSDWKKKCWEESFIRCHGRTQCAKRSRDQQTKTAVKFAGACRTRRRKVALGSSRHKYIPFTQRKV